MAIIISVGRWGGVYGYLGFGMRLCLGWIALTILPVDGDDIINAAVVACEQAAERVDGVDISG